MKIFMKTCDSVLCLAYTSIIFCDGGEFIEMGVRYPAFLSSYEYDVRLKAQQGSRVYTRIMNTHSSIYPVVCVWGRKLQSMGVCLDYYFW